ncbi:MAG: hypothetical protein WCV50_02825 [Patescibacteria group bacterium]
MPRGDNIISRQSLANSSGQSSQVKPVIIGRGGKTKIGRFG